MAYENDLTLSGVGFVPHGCGIVCLDLDHAADGNGHPLPWAQQVIDRLPGSHIELSPSGTGLRGFCRGELPSDGRRTAYGSGSVEMYCNRHYVTVTGRALHFAERLPDLQPEVGALYADLFGAPASGTIANIQTRMTGHHALTHPDDLQVLQKMFSGKRGQQLMKIWSGDYSDHQHNESDAELVLANALAFYCQKDPMRIERIMRAGLYRPKWDERRGDTTYLGLTIAKALDGCTKVWTPGFAKRATNTEEITPLDDQIAQLSQELREARAQIEEVNKLRAEDRRRDDAERRLHALTSFNANQKMAISVVSRLLGSALSRGQSALTVYRVEVASSLGISVCTAGRALKVFDLPGSPIERIDSYCQEHAEDGSTSIKKTILFNCQGVSSTIDIIDRMIAVGEQHVRPDGRKKTPNSQENLREPDNPAVPAARPSPVVVTLQEHIARTATDPDGESTEAA